MTSTTRKRLLKELQQSNNLPESVVFLKPISDFDLYEWKAIIHPSQNLNSFYKNGYFELFIKIPESYPLEPPKISFILNNNNKSKNNFKICRLIPHCNVDFKTGEICIDILKSENWSPAWTLQSALLAILVLLDNQEPDSPLNVDMANLFRINDKIAINSLINYYITNFSY